MNKLFILSFLLMIILNGCQDDGCTAGAGGDLTLVLTSKHHVKPIPGCTFKIKYNTKNFPGEDGAYDIVATAMPGDNSLTITGLKCGDYYIYSTGADTTLAIDNQRVKGGIPYSTEQESGIIRLDIPVTEVH